jgi:2-dehydro-3-deoxy-D-arabinonate dehydratase
MKICSFSSKGSELRHLGILSADDKQVVDLTEIDRDAFSSFVALVSKSEQSSQTLNNLIQSKLNKAGGNIRRFSLNDVVLRIPFAPAEVWAAGVTYFRSREAREVETSLKGLYTSVYGAERPEIFFKTTSLRCVGPEEAVGIRGDSKWNVPEPELTLVFGSDCRILGYTIGNDMSSREIEGLNPLYLPQAKIFKNCCSIGPVVATADEVPDPKKLQIKMEIRRGGSTAFEGSISTGMMKRTIEELVSFLGRSNVIPPVSALMTGTGIVPPDDFSLQHGDIIEITMDKVGTLRNTVATVS